METNFHDIDIRQIVVDNFEEKQDVADKIVNVITDPDAVYETINSDESNFSPKFFRCSS